MSRQKKRKKRVALDHEQKRQLAKKVLEGRPVKQAAAEWNVSLDTAHKVLQEYLIVYKVEKYPDAVSI